MPNPTQPAPIAPAEAAALFADLARFPLVALAVSGGPDSVALLHLYARWHAGKPDSPATLVLTVDHALRPQSASEAQFAANEATLLGFRHESLVWLGPKPASGLPNAARNARYRLLTERLAREHASSVALVTAHTQDDQAETLLMRLARGSGLDGLAGMQRERILSQDHAIMLIRPLLAISKERLEASLTAIGKTWVIDPTNADPSYERPRLRQSVAHRDAFGLSNAALALTASRLARANSALHMATVALDAAAVTHDPGLSATISRPAFNAAPTEIQIRLLACVLKACGGSHPRAQLGEIERLAARLRVPSATVTTLGGCYIATKDDTITIHREPGRGLPVADLLAGQSAIWDARFKVALRSQAPGMMTVRALSSNSWTVLRHCYPTIPAPPYPAALTIPAFWHHDQLVAAPQLGSLAQLEQPLHTSTPAPPPWLAPFDVLQRFEPLCTSEALAAKL